MPGPEDILAPKAEELRRGVTPTTLTVRQLLDSCGAARRGGNVVRRIRSALERLGLETVPDIEVAYVDGPLTLVIAGADGDRRARSTIYPVGGLDSANRKPVSVGPDSSLAEATTIMLARGFSQLPVMTSEREVKGAVTWRSVGGHLALGKSVSCARECMETPHLIDSEASLFDAIALVAAYDYVLVRAPDKVITGIVTASDLSEQFRDLAEPFLLVGEIEHLIRRLIHGKFSSEELQVVRDPADSDRTIEGVSDLTLGEHVRLLDEPARWERLGIQVDRREFIALMNDARGVRNDVMHFDPQGIDPAALQALQRFVTLLQELRRHGLL